jgi:hypothetical protein
MTRGGGTRGRGARGTKIQLMKIENQKYTKSSCKEEERSRTKGLRLMAGIFCRQSIDWIKQKCHHFLGWQYFLVSFSSMHLSL